MSATAVVLDASRRSPATVKPSRRGSPRSSSARASTETVEGAFAIWASDAPHVTIRITSVLGGDRRVIRPLDLVTRSEPTKRQEGEG